MFLNQFNYRLPDRLPDRDRFTDRLPDRDRFTDRLLDRFTDRLGERPFGRTDRFADPGFADPGFAAR
jgi:hypothetical protein